MPQLLFDVISDLLDGVGSGWMRSEINKPLDMSQRFLS
jgi:hypothetical protein